jgi:hypothetical protein
MRPVVIQVAVHLDGRQNTSQRTYVAFVRAADKAELPKPKANNFVGLTHHGASVCLSGRFFRGFASERAAQSAAGRLVADMGWQSSNV